MMIAIFIGLFIISYISSLIAFDKEKPSLIRIKQVFFDEVKNKKLFLITKVMGMIAIYCLLLFCYHNNEKLCIKWSVILPYLFIFAMEDKDTQLIRNKPVIVFLGFSILCLIVEMFVSPAYIKAIFLNSIIGCVVMFGFVGICALITRGGIGGGDLKLLSVLGFVLGLRGAYNILFFTVVLCAAFGIFMLATKKLSSKDSVPMAPFILLGYLVTILLGT